MGKAKWWVCGGCHSLNDLPANKCYKCRAPKPADARLMDDSYSEVTVRRVGITVDLARVSELSQPDPVEKQAGAGIIEAFVPESEDRTAPTAPVREPYDPYGAFPDAGEPAPLPQRPATSPPPVQRPGPPPLREPVRRGIEALGGRREWAEGYEAQPAVGPPPAPVPDVPSPPPNAMSTPPPLSPASAVGPPRGPGAVPPAGYGRPPGAPPPPPGNAPAPGYAPPPFGARPSGPPPPPPAADTLPPPPRDPQATE